MKPDFDKYADKLVPAIIQDGISNKVLMLGYMNETAYNRSIEEKKVIFYSRSKQRLWMKGETSGNYLLLDTIMSDCDNDCLLIKAFPSGPVCHTGTDTCFAEENTAPFLPLLEKIIQQRKANLTSSSYTSLLFQKGINKIAQKVGEEAIELVIEAKDNSDELFKNEAADLLYHYLVLLQAKGFYLADIERILEQRRSK